MLCWKKSFCIFKVIKILLFSKASKTSSYFENEYTSEYSLIFTFCRFITNCSLPLFQMINADDAAVNDFSSKTDFI